MKLKNIDKVKKDDILVINSETGLRGAYKIGERFIFVRFNKSLPMSASTVYLKKESTNESIAFVVGIVKNLEISIFIVPEIVPPVPVISTRKLLP